LLALSFPKFGHPAFGWIALAPLLVALVPRRGRSLTRAFGLGVATGLVYFAGTLYWITRVMAVYGGLTGWVAVLVNALLVAYLALFPGLFAVVMRRLLVVYGARAHIAAPMVWVATELGRRHLFGGFPWVLLGYSQATTLPVAQLASLFGVYGVSALVVSVSAAASFCATTSSRRDRGKAAGAVALLLVAVVVWGSRRAARAEWTRAGEPLQVGLIQGNVDVSERVDSGRGASIFQNYLRMTRQAIGAGAELVVWPESSTPFAFDEDPDSAAQVRTLARQARVPILLGSDEFEWRAVDSRRVVDRSFNSAFLVRADGSTGGVYRKIHLVPFGEYVPLKRLLFFAAPLVEAVGSGFDAGEDATLLPVGGHRISVAICYEIVYPDLVRQFVRGGSELLTTITNDAWFGATSAPYQHFAQASMRAIEEGRYLVRSANTGISGIVDPYGRILAQTDIFRPAVVVGPVRFLQEWTIYARVGDVIPYTSVVIACAMLAFAGRRIQ
jgi:apolipoprotein N-acyltransferase